MLVAIHGEVWRAVRTENAVAVLEGSVPSAEVIGACGQIDPSRHAPGLRHFVLFRWNEPGAPQVQLMTDLSTS